MINKDKGPAEVAASPSHGSVNPAKDQEMNTDRNSTSAPVRARVVDLNTLQSNAWHLYHLLDDAVDGLQEMDFVRDEYGNCPLDRMAALAWIARDHAERIAQDIHTNVFEIQRGGAR